MGNILEGRVAVLTGSGQGIGRAIAIGMAKEGAKVVTNNRRPGSTGHAILNDSVMNLLNEEQKEWVFKLQEEYTGDAETTAKMIREGGGEAVPFFGDVSNFEIARQLIQAAVDSFGKVDILVNTVGTFGFSPIWKMTEELWDHVTLVKPKSHFNCIRHAAPIMMEQKWGRILNCTSRAFLGDIIRHAEYCAANAGVVGLTRAAAIELYPYGITCNAFSPFARTRASFELIAYSMAFDGVDKPFIHSGGGATMTMENTPSPDYIAPFLVYLASEAAAKISGTVFNIGGTDISMYSEPAIIRSLYKDGDPWTINELIAQVPRALLRGYRSVAIPSTG